jgi:hypothetical protein
MVDRRKSNTPHILAIVLGALFTIAVITLGVLWSHHRAQDRLRAEMQANHNDAEHRAHSCSAELEMSRVALRRERDNIARTHSDHEDHREDLEEQIVTLHREIGTVREEKEHLTEELAKAHEEWRKWQGLYSAEVEHHKVTSDLLDRATARPVPQPVPQPVLPPVKLPLPPPVPQPVPAPHVPPQQQPSPPQGPPVPQPPHVPAPHVSPHNPPSPSPPGAAEAQAAAARAHAHRNAVAPPTAREYVVEEMNMDA